MPEAEPLADSLAPLRRRLDLDEALEPYADLRWTGRLAGSSTLCVDDFTAIPFLDVPGAEEYQHRGRLRADDGDYFAAVTEPCPGYETYCRDALALGKATLIRAGTSHGRWAVARSCEEPPAIGELVDAAVREGSLAIHPYMSIDAVWRLGRLLAAETKVPIEVLGPPPPVMWIANDKGTLGEVVETLLGAHWLVETRLSAEPSEMAANLIDLATRHRKVGLKRLRCASASGNQVFDSARLHTMPVDEVRHEVAVFLERTEWDRVEKVQTVAWEVTDLSPSTQIWIPPAGVDPPHLDGVYEQILTGEEGVFVGSRPSTLPASVNRRLGEAALRIAAAFQTLGYVGRCSFDHLVLGDPEGDDCRLVFTECNGRWGGTSIPMSLVDRLVAGPRPPYRAQDFMNSRLVGVSFAEILDCARSQLYDPRGGEGTFVFYNVGPLAEHGKLDVVALAASQEEAEEAIEERLPRLLGLR